MQKNGKGFIEMNIGKWIQNNKEVTLYLTYEKNKPLIIFNTYVGDGKSIIDKMTKTECSEFNLLVVGNLIWNHDMTPWHCPPLSKNDTPCTGGADDFLSLLTNDIIPNAKEKINGEPKFIGISGYSLAGLFAVYTIYNTDVFDRVASISGSLWYPEFIKYCTSHEIKKLPDRMYFSLGDKEANTRNAILKTVQENTENLSEYYKSLKIEVTYELNPGNHFRDEDIRIIKGIKAILK